MSDGLEEHSGTSVRGAAPPVTVSPSLSALFGRKSKVSAAVLLPQGPTFAPDIAFLMYHGAPVGALYRATERSKAIGVSARKCLIAAGDLTEAALADTAALHFGVQRLGAAEPDPRSDIAAVSRQGWCRATLADGAEVIVISVTGPAFPILLGKLSNRAHVAVATEAEVRALMREGFSARIAAEASATLAEIESARLRTTPAQRLVLGAMALLLAGALITAPALTLTLVPLALGVVFLTAAIIQLAACWEGWRIGPAPVALRDAALPLYSVLVPLHREGAAVIGPLVAALDALEYPREKLQILLLVETGDALTQEAIAATPLPPHIAMFVVPDGAPRTKPRALNAAMPFVTGEHVVVFDAEDRPDPLQLRKAVALFRAAGPRVACLQARLAIDNCGDGLLPAFFRIEYAGLFDVTKAGSARMGHPIPLGGTSNHFRTDVLRAIGLWDAWNVTEDADLGFRLARRGYRVADLVSTTDEEAPASLSGWMAQRTRWLKGWLQTILTHSRQPVTLWRDLGTMNLIAAGALSLGVVVGTLFSPVFYGAVIWRIASGNFFAGGALLDAAADAFIVVLGIFGLFSTFLPPLIATGRRDLKGLRRLIPLLPLYHLLMLLAGWRAVYELIRAPHRWNKTTHGLAQTSRANKNP